MRVLLLLALVLALGAPRARAEDPPAPSAAERAARERQLLRAWLEAERLADERRWAEAAARAREALDLSLALHGPTGGPTGNLQVALASILQELGLVDEARERLEATIAAHEPAPGETPSILRAAFLAKARQALARLHLDAGQYAEADRLLEVSIAALEAALARAGPLGAPVRLALARGLSDRAQALLGLGRLPEALEASLLGLARAQAAVGPRSTEVVPALVTLAAVRQARGEPGEVLPLVERALSMVRSDAAAAAAWEADLLGSLGVALGDLGRHDEALAAVQRSLTLPVGSGPGAARGFSLRSDSLALALWHLGETAAALRAAERAAQAHERRAGPRHPDTLLALGNFAVMLVASGQVDPGLRLQQRVLASAADVLGASHPKVGWLEMSLGVTLTEAGRLPDAVPHLRRALEIAEESEGPSHLSVAWRAGNLAMALEQSGQAGEARSLMLRAVRIVEDRLGPEHPDTATWLERLATLEGRQGGAAKARSLLERALAISLSTLGPTHRATIQRLHAVAVQAAAEGRVVEARERFAQALDALERTLVRDLVALAGPERLALARTARLTLATFAERASDLGITGYEEVLRFKGLVGRLERRQASVIRRGDARVRSALEAARVSARRLAALAQRVPAAAAPDARQAWRSDYVEASAAHESRSRELNALLAVSEGEAGAPRRDLAAVRGALAPDALLVDFLRTSRRYLAWAVPPGGPVVRVDLGEVEAIDAAAQAFAAHAARATSSGDPELAVAGARLRRLVLDPLEPWLGHRPARLLLALDGALAAVPFAALPSARAGRGLLDDAAIEQVAYAQDLLPGWAPGLPDALSLVLGDVDFGVAADVAAPRAGVAAPIALRGRAWRPLPGTAAEVDALVRRRPAATQVLRGGEATEAALRASVAGKRALHLATHGFVSAGDRLESALDAVTAVGGSALDEVRLSRADPRALCGIALAGANALGDRAEDDGVLTALEVAQLDLGGCERVALSACETALGRVEAGEGVIGLVQAFQTAGARDVVASLWKVDDRATALLMQRFYDGVLREKDPLPTAQALREAALWLREAKPEGRDYSAPRYWATFVAYERR